MHELADYSNFQKNEWAYPFLALKQGENVVVRGLLTREIENFSCTFSPRNYFFPFKGRKLSYRYIFAELFWYASGDRNNTDIEKYAKTWTQIKSQTKPYWNSNYGYYLNDNLHNLVLKFKKDPNTRRAVIMILNNEILNSDTKDTCCTYCMSFSIRNNKLKGRVRMRSTDAIYGLTNDIPQFLFYQEFLYVALKNEPEFANLELGDLHFATDSLHIYETHFEMYNKILSHIENDETEERFHIDEITYADYEFFLNRSKPFTLAMPKFYEVALRTSVLK